MERKLTSTAGAAANCSTADVLSEFEVAAREELRVQLPIPSCAGAALRTRNNPTGQQIDRPPLTYGATHLHAAPIGARAAGICPAAASVPAGGVSARTLARRHARRARATWDLISRSHLARAAIARDGGGQARPLVTMPKRTAPAAAAALPRATISWAAKRG